MKCNIYDQNDFKFHGYAQCAQTAEDEQQNINALADAWKINAISMRVSLIDVFVNVLF